MSDGTAPARWTESAGTTLQALARNLSTRYVAIGVESAVGLVLLPFNIAHLGRATYGLWMLAASVTGYFSLLDLGYAGALTKFVAHYRARHDAGAINEIASTLFFLFAALGVAAIATAALVATWLGPLFNLSPAEAATGRTILLVISVQVGFQFVFSVFGAVVNGFQRYDLNNLVGAATTIIVALVNVVILGAGLGAVPLIIGTTAVRLAALAIYRRNAYRVFPELKISLSLIRRARLREVTGFSVFVAVLDWAAKVNYSLDAMVIGAFLGTVFVGAWTISQRLAEAIQRLTNQLNDMLFPAIVDSDASQQADRLRQIFLQGTRLSLATVLPVAVTAAMLAGPLLDAWVGHGSGSVLVTRLLAAVVIVRVGTATSMTVLKGAGGHRLLAALNVVVAAFNVALSLFLVRRMGLTGVALGTLVPVSVGALFVMFPAACRRSGVTVFEAMRSAVWPAAWPAVVVAAWLTVAEAHVATSLLSVGLWSVSAGLLYLVLFLAWGVPRSERQFYISKAAGLLSRVRSAEATT